MRRRGAQGAESGAPRESEEARQQLGAWRAGVKRALWAAGLFGAGEWTLEAEGRDALAAGGRAARPARDGITI